VAAIAFAARVAIRREFDSHVSQSQKLRSKARIDDPTEPESSRLGQYKLREDDLIKPTKKGAFGFGNIRDNQTGHRPVTTTFVEPVLMPFEILNRAFMFLRCCLALESAEIFSFARSRIFLSGIQPILSGFQSPNHNDSLGALVTATQILRRMRSDARRPEYLRTQAQRRH
jgi:hypothetical protein